MINKVTRIKSYKLFAITTIFGIGLSACGGGDNTNSTTAEEVVLKGIFEDSKVIGLDYSTNTKSGKTDASGEFEYIAGETITFKVGDITLGSTLGAERISTFDIGDSLKQDSYDVNRAILLQSLDNNQNPADGFIDLTGIVASPSTGVTLDGGITQEKLDLITGEVGKVTLVTAEDAVSHATVSSNEAVVEEDGILKLNTVLTQADIDAGNYRVYNKIGIELNAPETTTADPTFSIESDLTVISQQDLDQGRLRNAMTIIDSTNQYYLGLGIRYKDGSYSPNYYIERYGQSGYIEFPNIRLPAFEDVVIEENKTYNFKLEIHIDTDEIFAYIDGVKVITWNNVFSAQTVNQAQDDITILQAYAETTARSAIDPITGVGETAGAAIIGTFDNLIVHLDGQDILTDNFDDNTLDNPDINYLARNARGKPRLTTAILTQSPWYLVSDENGDCYGKFTHNSDGTSLAEGVDDDENDVSINLTYTIDTYKEMSLTFPDDFIVDGSAVGTQKYELLSLSSSIMNMKLTDNEGTEHISAFKSHSEAISHATTRGNPNCATYMPE